MDTALALLGLFMPVIGMYLLIFMFGLDNNLDQETIETMQKWKEKFEQGR